MQRGYKEAILTSQILNRNQGPKHNAQQHWRQKLANDFADYFIEKIQKIWDDLDANPKFKPKRNSTITPPKSLNLQQLMK